MADDVTPLGTLVRYWNLRVATPDGTASICVNSYKCRTPAYGGTVNEEKYRLVFVGVPCYPIFRRFNELFSEWGGAFVSSTYLWFASGGAGLGWQYDLSRPIESLAEGALISVRHAMDSMFFNALSRW